MNGTTLSIADRTAALEVIDYDVSLDATPLAPGDTSGGVGSISVRTVSVVDGPITGRSSTVVDKDAILSDTETIDFTGFVGRGSLLGRIRRNEGDALTTTFSADTILSRLNVNRKAKPFFGVRTTGTRVTYATNLCTNPSVETVTTGYVAIPGTSGTAAVTRSNVTYPAFAGTWHGRVTWTVSATASGGLSYTVTGLGSSATLYTSIQMRSSRIAQAIVPTIKWKDAGGAVLATTVGSTVILNNANYVEVPISGVGPVGAVTQAEITWTSTTLGTGTGNWVNGDILIFDALLITTSQGVTYFDGSYPNASWLGAANASASQLAITVNVDEGYDATLGNAVRYYIGLVGIPETSIIVDPEFDLLPVALPAWENSVWLQLKKLCAAYGAEIAPSGEFISFRRPRQHDVVIESIIDPRRALDTQASALAVPIWNYNSHWGTDEVVYQSTTVYNVDVGSYSETVVNIESSVTNVNSPKPVTRMSDVGNYTGSGEYVVLDANNVIVNPGTWVSLGGRVETYLIAADEYNQFRIAIYGPRTNGEYTAPFRIGQQGSGGDELAAMVITGGGVISNRKLVTLPTAASEEQTSTELASTIDNEFLTNLSQTVDRGILAAMQAGGPLISLSGSLTYDRTSSGDDFGMIVGGRIRHDDNVYRIRSAHISGLTIDFVAEIDVTFNDAVEVYSVTFDENNLTNTGKTFTTYNALWAPGTTFAQAMATVPSPTFNDINAIYTGMTFNDHALYPLLTGAPSAPSRL